MLYALCQRLTALYQLGHGPLHPLPLRGQLASILHARLNSQAHSLLLFSFPASQLLGLSSCWHSNCYIKGPLHLICLAPRASAPLPTTIRLYLLDQRESTSLCGPPALKFLCSSSTFLPIFHSAMLLHCQHSGCEVTGLCLLVFLLTCWHSEDSCILQWLPCNYVPEV